VKGDPFISSKPLEKRFLLYDRILLNILSKRTLEGKDIFSMLFKRNKINGLFSFLDNESSMLEELYLMNTLPQWPFIKSGLELITVD
jgi:lycopene beta-cyclase